MKELLYAMKHLESLYRAPPSLCGKTKSHQVDSCGGLAIRGTFSQKLFSYMKFHFSSLDHADQATVQQNPPTQSIYFQEQLKHASTYEYLSALY